MADYKRFVSYMYEYENGIKKKNVGYARVETRNGECRFTIHMQLDGIPEGIFPTYLIHRPTEEMELVYLGDCNVKNQIMDSRLSAKEFNVMDSGHRFSDMGGILLFLNSGVFYATQWDDKPVVLEEVLQALKPKPKSQVVIEKKTKIKEELEATKTSEQAKAEAKAHERAPEKIPEKAPEKIPEKAPVESMPILVKDPIAASAASTDKSVDAKASTSKINDDSKVERPRYILPGGGMMNPSLLQSKQKLPLNPWELVKRFEETESKKVAEAEKNEPEAEKQVAEAEKQATEAEKQVAEAVSNAIYNKRTPVKRPMEENRLNENPLTARIFTSFPRIYPFEDNEITRCVKVEPKDIGALPSDTWILSNNSFLLHGYYCYHHLIFAEIKDRYGCRYMLGVPGIYHNRERFMARMFGFECFKSIRKRELKQGDFGYWYLEVNF